MVRAEKLEINAEEVTFEGNEGITDAIAENPDVFNRIITKLLLLSGVIVLGLVVWRIGTFLQIIGRLGLL